MIVSLQGKTEKLEMVVRMHVWCHQIEQLGQLEPLVTGERTIGQDISELCVGVDMLDLDFWIQVNLVQQPVQVNTVNLGNMSHGWTTAFDDHLDRGIVTSKIDSEACGLELCAF